MSEPAPAGRPTPADAPATAGPPRNLVGYGPFPPKVRWPDGGNVALSFVVNYEEGSEYSHPAGDGRNDGLAEIPPGMPAEYRDLAVESVYEYGSRAGAWRLLRLFDEYQVKATFFAAAVALEHNPEIGRWIQQAGHEPCSHGWRWSEHWLLDRDTERHHIHAAIESITRTCGQRPVGWYCRYAPSINTRELLVEEGGFLYDSDAYNDDLPYFTTVNHQQHLVIPYTFTYNDVRFVAAQGFGSPSDFVDLVTRGLDELRREGAAGQPKLLSVGLHPRVIGQAGRSTAVRQIIEYALGAGDVWICRRDELARWWLAQHETFGR